MRYRLHGLLHEVQYLIICINLLTVLHFHQFISCLPIPLCHLIRRAEYSWVPGGLIYYNVPLEFANSVINFKVRNFICRLQCVNFCTEMKPRIRKENIVHKVKQM